MTASPICGIDVDPLCVIVYGDDNVWTEIVVPVPVVGVLPSTGSTSAPVVVTATSSLLLGFVLAVVSLRRRVTA